MPTFCNLYVINVGPPGVGKSVPAEITKGHLEKLKELVVVPGTDRTNLKNLVNFAPDSLTAERLIESMSNSTESIKVCDNPKKFYVHCSITFYLTQEVTILLKKNEDFLVDFLTSGWSGTSFKRETKKGDRFNIQQMCVNFFGTTTEDRLAKCLNYDIISEGFTARTIFLYGDSKYHNKDFLPSPDQRAALEEIKTHWKKLSKVFGQITLDKEAEEWRDYWKEHRQDKHGNQEKKLQHFFSRRLHHLDKMAMVCHFGEKLTLVLDTEDYEKAERELLCVEKDMHKALKSMGRNPIHVLAEEIHRRIEQLGTMSGKRIVADHFSGGNADEIRAALEHKVLIGEFKTYNEGNILMYQLNGKALEIEEKLKDESDLPK